MKQIYRLYCIIVFILIVLILILNTVIVTKLVQYKEDPRTYILYIVDNNTTKEPLFLTLEPKEGLWDALEYYEIQHPEIVYAQAIQESGLGKSNVYLRTNNLFGLYNSKTKDYYKFNHWSESVIAYKDYIQRKYEPPNDYYQFLKRIGYAEDSAYIQKLQKIVRNEQRKSFGRDTISS